MTGENVDEPTVSIIVPVLNAEATVGALLGSLIQVDYDQEKLETILIDGGSTDRTRVIIEGYPVRLILEKKRGLNVARNTGLKNSQGEIVFFTDSDCVVPKDWVRKMLKNFEIAEVGCAGGNVLRYEDIFLSRYADDSIVPVLRRFRKHEVLDNVGPPLRYPAGCNMAFRRAAIEKVNGFDEDIRYGFDEDELVERVCKAGYKMVLDPETVVKHQHRVSLNGLLRQTFNYGRGGALLFKKKKAKDRIARWNLATFVFFAAWLVTNVFSTFLTIAGNLFFLVPILLTTVVPFLLLALFYVYRALRESYCVMMVAYPFIDVLRVTAYCVGEMYGMIE